MNKKLKSKIYFYYFRIKQFCNDWIYPAYKIKNYFFNRYDIVKLHQIKRTQYCDIIERMLFANMNLVNDFIQRQKPQKYVLWYYDEVGNQIGHKYGQSSKSRMFIPQYKNKFIMDIIKEIYNWWNVGYPQKQKQLEYLRQFWSQNINGQIVFEQDEQNDVSSSIQFDKSKCPKIIDDIKNANFPILDKYFKREDLLKDDIVFNKIQQLQNQIYEEQQKYLHLSIQVRAYLWT